MKKILVSLFAAAAFFLPAQSQAADFSGLYVAPKFALNIQHAKGTFSAAGTEYGSASATKTSAGGALAIGYDFSKKFDIPLRAELEYGAYGNVSKTLDTGDVTRAVALDYLGKIVVDSLDVIESKLETKIGIQTLLANVYWDITTWNNFTPYVGAGIGVAFVKTEVTYNEHTVDDQSNWEANPSYSADNSEAVFAGQIGVGCAYAVTDNISVDLAYRFLMMEGSDVKIAEYKIETSSNHAHQIMLGVRMTF